MEVLQWAQMPFSALSKVSGVVLGGSTDTGWTLWRCLYAEKPEEVGLDSARLAVLF